MSSFNDTLSEFYVVKNFREEAILLGLQSSALTLTERAVSLKDAITKQDPKVGMSLKI
jgi:hypothetical protein